MSKSPLLLSVSFFAAEKLGDVRDGLDGRQVIDWGSGDRPESLAGVKYALVWDFDHDLFERMPDLEIIFNAGAGVDKIMANPNLPEDVPIVRLVDPTLTLPMSEWVCLQCLMHLRQQRRYDAQQQNREWEGLPQPQANTVNVGIMGMGVLGQDAAKKLIALGFNVSGWSRTKKEVDGVECYDAAGLDAFLARNHYIVGLLPFTAETKHFYNRALFEKLARHPHLPTPVFMNAGRGGSQVEEDIISCLEDGTLGGVSLDVFETEPLAKDSPIWGFENAIITPHAAANSNVVAMGKYVETQIQRHEAGLGLENVIDRERGY